MTERAIHEIEIATDTPQKYKKIKDYILKDSYYSGYENFVKFGKHSKVKNLNKYSVKKICVNCGTEYTVTKYSKAKTGQCRDCSRVSIPNDDSRIYIAENIEKNADTFIKNRKEHEKFKDNPVLINYGYWDIEKMKTRKFL